MIRRQALQLAAGLLAAAAFTAQAAEFPIPGKPITLVLPSTPGSAGDQVLRMLADKLKDDWKAAPIIVESKAGAGGFIGSQFVARAAPDGHTMLLGFSVLVQAAAFGQNPPFDTEKDFIPVARLNDVPLALYTGDLSINSLADFVAKAKAKPAEFNFGTYGAATTGHAYSALINIKNGMELTHVPFRGTQPLVNALLGGHVKSGVSNLDGMAHVKAGKLKVLAVTGTKRSVLLPDVPTFAEQGLHRHHLRRALLADAAGRRAARRGGEDPRFGLPRAEDARRAGEDDRHRPGADAGRARGCRGRHEARDRVLEAHGGRDGDQGGELTRLQPGSLYFARRFISFIRGIESLRAASMRRCSVSSLKDTECTP